MKMHIFYIKPRRKDFGTWLNDLLSACAQPQAIILLFLLGLSACKPSGSETTPVMATSGMFEIYSTNLSQPSGTNELLVSLGTEVKILATNGDLLLVEFPPQQSHKLDYNGQQYLTERSAFDVTNNKCDLHFHTNAIIAWTGRFNICSERELLKRLKTHRIPDYFIIESSAGKHPIYSDKSERTLLETNGLIVNKLVNFWVWNGGVVTPDFVWFDRSLCGEHVTFDDDNNIYISNSSLFYIPTNANAKLIPLKAWGD